MANRNILERNYGMYSSLMVIGLSGVRRIALEKHLSEQDWQWIATAHTLQAPDYILYEAYGSLTF